MVVVYPLGFIDACNGNGGARVTALARPHNDDASTNRSNECCPNCCLPAAMPFVSRYLPGCVVEHHWLCKTCEFGWTSRFDPLLV
jgi:hypothetical protein